MAVLEKFVDPSFGNKSTRVRSNTTNFYNAVEIQNSLGQINGKFCRAFYWEGPGFNYSDRFNINSITNYGGGLYDLVFTNPMPTDRYTVIVSAQHSRNINDGNRIFFHVRNRTVNLFRVETIGGNGETGQFDALDFACIIYSSSFFH